MLSNFAIVQGDLVCNTRLWVNLCFYLHIHRTGLVRVVLTLAVGVCSFGHNMSAAIVVETHNCSEFLFRMILRFRAPLCLTVLRFR